MQVEVGAHKGEVRPSGGEDMTKIRELYGLAVRLLPSALVLALAEPLLLLPEPPSPPCIVFPTNLPSYWQHRPRRWTYRAQGMRNSGTSTK
jgi:hypothetical protein